MSAIPQHKLGAAWVLVAIAAALAALMATVQNRLEQAPGFTPGPVAGQRPERPAYNYAELRRNIIYGKASLGEARRAMTDTDPAALSNTVHALFAMRWHRGVVHLLNGMWALDKEKYPELAWDLIAKAPVRIALASTINRIRIVKTEAFQDYIRAHQHDRHEFNRAQVAVALGLNGDPMDLPYLRDMSDGNNHYVAQSAITALSLFGGETARDILIALAGKHQGTARGNLMTEMLRTAYAWPPP